MADDPPVADSHNPPVSKDVLVAFLATLATAVRELETAWQQGGAPPNLIRGRLQDLALQAEESPVATSLTDDDIQSLRRLHGLFADILNRDDLLIDSRFLRRN